MFKFVILLFFSLSSFAQSSDQDSSWWGNTKKFLEDSSKNLTELVVLNKTLDEEVANELNKSTHHYNKTTPLYKTTNQIKVSLPTIELERADVSRLGFG